ncbi:Na+/H+ antiporter NhaC family protein [Clostridiaceae bacterium 35-E11]
MEYGFLSLVPPLVTIALAMWTRQVALSLFAGMFLGFMVITGGNIFGSLNGSFDTVFSVFASSDNIKVFIFNMLMGAFIVLIQASGGVEGFIEYLTIKTEKIKNRKAAAFLAYIIGIIIFVDGYLSIILSGIVVRPLADRFKVSREMLAYICDSTSAPINALIPLNSWGAMFMGLIGAQITAGVINGNPMTLLIQSLPFQFYSIMSVLFVAYFITTGKHWGPMKKAEERVIKTGQLLREDAHPVVSKDTSDTPIKEGLSPDKWNFVFPFSILLGTIAIGLYVTGEGNLIKGDGTTAIFWGILLSLTLSAVFFKVKKVMTVNEYLDYVFKGIGGIMPLVILLVFSFAIGKVVKELGAGQYLASLVEGKVSGGFGPAIIFIMGAIMAFSTGTSWGTFAMMMPIAVPMAVAMDASIVVSIGAVISGGIFGDHCSPLSDTTILASMAASADPYDHIKTQLPYAIQSAAVAIVLYIIAGFIL